MALSLGLISLLAFGVGSVNAAVITVFPAWQRLYAILTRPLVLISGVMFDLEGLPTVVRDVLAWNPVAHGVALFRVGYFYGYRGTFLDLTYLVSCGTLLTLLGLTLEKMVRIRR